jgi:hypothetical protein
MLHAVHGDSRIHAERGLTVSRYPNGFRGSALQVVSYFAEGRGGFYIATKDRQCAAKDLSFSKATDDKSLVVDYPVVIAALNSGSWYTAADRYRTWAVQQPWCKRGSLEHRVSTGDACRWLLENTGAVGAWWPFRNDIRPDIARTRQYWGSSILHLELGWSHGPSHEATQSDGTAITRAYVSRFEENQHRVSRIKGSYVLVGTECVREPFVGCLDFCYARNA